MKRLLRRRRGFTLVEVSLALLVMAVGVLGAFALFPHALAESQRASAETQASMFAETVFQTLRARAQYKWSEVGMSFQTYGPGSRGDAKVWMVESPIRASGNVEFYTNSVVVSGRAMTETGLRYRLEITAQSEFVKIATLIIWPGMFGDTPIPSQYGIPDVPTYVYVTGLYREYYDP